MAVLALKFVPPEHIRWLVDYLRLRADHGGDGQRAIAHAKAADRMNLKVHEAIAQTR